MHHPEKTDMMLWLDLETTGADELAGDEIVEIACVLTTVDLNEVAAFAVTIHPSAVALARLMELPPVREMHEQNGLLAELLTTDTSLAQASRDLVAFLEANGAKPGETILAGSGVTHFDSRFIRYYLPDLNAFLRHWMIDIGVARRMHEMWVGELPSTVNELKTHRALDDVYCHLEEARVFSAMWQEDAARRGA